MLEILGRLAGELTNEGRAYLIALVGTTVLAVCWRFAMAPQRPVVAEPISPTELAYLRSDVAPVVTALASLRAGGRITEDGRVDSTVGGVEPDSFTRKVLKRVAVDPDHTVPGLYVASRLDIAEMEQELAERGLVRTPADRTRMRWGTVPSIVLILVGVCYIVYLATHMSAATVDKVPTVIVMIVASVIYGAFILPNLLDINRLTRAGKRLLAAQERQYAYLKPSKRPAFETYGVAAVALSAALFGTGALWAIDPDYSSAVQAAGGAGGDGTGGGCGGGSSCGGASCGGGGGGCGSGCGSGCGGCGGG